MNGKLVRRFFGPIAALTVVSAVNVINYRLESESPMERVRDIAVEGGHIVVTGKHLSEVQIWGSGIRCDNPCKSDALIGNARKTEGTWGTVQKWKFEIPREHIYAKDLYAVGFNYGGELVGIEYLGAGSEEKLRRILWPN